MARHPRHRRGTATQVEVVFTDALDTEGLWPAVEARQADRARHGDGSDEEPILLAMSDNGPQMRAGTVSVREFLALCSIAARFGRPGTPTDQAWIETLFGHIKTEWPHLEKITDPNTLRTELDNARLDYNTRRLHASLGYVTPDDEHQGEESASARPAKTASTGPASPASPTIATTNPTSHEHTRPMRRNQTPENGHLLRSTSDGGRDGELRCGVGAAEAGGPAGEVVREHAAGEPGAVGVEPS